MAKGKKNEFFISLIHNPKKIPFLHAGTFPTRSVVPDHVIERRIIAEEYIKKKFTKDRIFYFLNSQP